MRKKILLSLPLLIGILSFSLYHAPQAHAAGSTIVVNSTADDIDPNDGECTLREAILAANLDTASGSTPGECIAGNGADTIEFNITHTSGGDTFTNQGHTGYIIKPNGSALPSITTQMTIDGYLNNPNARANTNPSPQPLNGILLIQLDGTSAGSGAAGLNTTSAANHVRIQGLVISNFDGNGIAGSGGGTNTVITGNYIGTDPTGMHIRANGSEGVQMGDGLQLGGTNPADRNIISGNFEGGASPVGDSHWVVQGNYVGVGADGVTALPNCGQNATNALSVDNATDVLIGGTQTGAANVISGNNKGGINPDGSTGVTIQGNLIGTDWTGMIAVPNQYTGVAITNDDTTTLIGGTTAAARNIISGNNGPANVLIGGFPTLVTGTVVEGNYIGTNSAGAIDPSFSQTDVPAIYITGNTTNNIIGGTAAGAGNIIAGGQGAGIQIMKLIITAAGPLVLTPTNNAILGNSIYGNTTSSIPDSTGQAIDLYSGTDSSPSPDFIPDSYSDVGPNSVQPTGKAPSGDPEANDYINAPVVTGFTQNGTNGSVNFSLNDAGGTNGYRVEFFASNSNSPVQAKTFLGSTNVSSGSSQTASLTLPVGTNLTNQFITASVTQLVDPSTNSGFGDTSELSATPVKAFVLAASTPGAPNTGMGRPSSLVTAASLLSLSGLTILSAYALRRKVKRYYVYSKQV